jgi:hypothetical protein
MALAARPAPNVTLQVIKIPNIVDAYNQRDADRLLSLFL